MGPGRGRTGTVRCARPAMAGMAGGADCPGAGISECWKGHLTVSERGFRHAGTVISLCWKGHLGGLELVTHGAGMCISGCCAGAFVGWFLGLDHTTRTTRAAIVPPRSITAEVETWSTTTPPANAPKPIVAWKEAV